ncbi:hypothetical protein V496_08599, partial [Pseudogymnoascus sp. VKM F-4515 (FW-2607)]
SVRSSRKRIRIGRVASSSAQFRLNSAQHPSNPSQKASLLTLSLALTRIVSRSSASDNKRLLPLFSARLLAHFLCEAEGLLLCPGANISGASAASEDALSGRAAGSGGGFAKARGAGARGGLGERGAAGGGGAASG